MATDKYTSRWTLNNTLNDASGNGHNLSTSSGTATYSSGPGGGQACDTGDYYLKATGITLSKCSTISVWGKTSVSGRMLWGYKNSSGQHMDLYCNSYYTLNTGDNNANLFKDVHGNNIPILTDNQWHLFTVTFGSDLPEDWYTTWVNWDKKESTNPLNKGSDINGRAMLYIDAVYRGSAISYVSPLLNSGTFALGSWLSNNNFIWKGSLCDARIYNRILSPEDILTLYEERAGEASLWGPTSSTDLTLKDWIVATPTTTGLQKFTGKNKFEVSGLSSTGLTEEGFCKRDYTIKNHESYDNISVYQVTSGAAVVIQNNSFENEADAKLSGLGVAKNIVGDNVYNAVWNDMVDCIEVPKNTLLEYGKCYVFDGKSYRLSSKYLEDGILGIHSDTAGFYVGAKEKTCLEIAIAGFALAYVDKEYKPGTPLTCGENGYLTELKEEDIERNPHKIVGTFWKKEWGSWWGFNNPKASSHIIETNGRMWIKVK